MNQKPRAIICSKCGQDTFVRPVPLYDGLSRKGEKFICVSCGHEYSGPDQVPFQDRRPPHIFDDDSPLSPPPLFDTKEEIRNCRRCVHYVVHPFAQRCALRGKAVESTDVCDDFRNRPQRPPGPQHEAGLPERPTLP